MSFKRWFFSKIKILLCIVYLLFLCISFRNCWSCVLCCFLFWRESSNTFFLSIFRYIFIYFGLLLSNANSNFLLIILQINNLWEIVPAEPGDKFLSMLPPWHMYERACEYFIFTLGVEQVYTTVKHLKVFFINFVYGFCSILNGMKKIFLINLAKGIT